MSHRSPHRNHSHHSGSGSGSDVAPRDPAAERAPIVRLSRALSTDAGEVVEKIAKAAVLAGIAFAAHRFDVGVITDIVALPILDKGEQKLKQAIDGAAANVRKRHRCPQAGPGGGG